MKTLIFEGAGWKGADTSKATDVTNCRIRTRLRNNGGRVIYLEMGCCHFENPKFTPEYAKGLNYATHIDHLFYCDSKWDNNRNYSRDLQPLANTYFEYNKENILKFVNEKLNCSFDDMIVYNNNEVRVHDTIDPLCSCAEGEYKNYQYKDIEININELNGIKPICGKEWFAAYKISHNSLMQLPYIKKHFEEMKKQIIQFKEKDNKVYFRWNKNGIITDLTIHTTGVRWE
jgi:hypothetical protein